MNGNGNGWVWKTIIMLIIAWAAMTFRHETKISVHDEQISTMKDTLKSIDTKLDTLILRRR